MGTLGVFACCGCVIFVLILAFVAAGVASWVILELLAGPRLERIEPFMSASIISLYSGRAFEIKF